ncbi:MAG: hypothetical protein LBL73_00200 [Synergistaceae bacterium]|nr:hypothetical protein [Synergistaceae bacterium]
MLFTIGELLSRHGVNVENTPYDAQDEINSCVFDAADFFGIADIEKYKMDFAGSRKRVARIKSIESDDAYIALLSRLEVVKGRLGELGKYGRQKSLFHSADLTGEAGAIAGEIRSLRAEKARLSEEMEVLTVQKAGVRKETAVLTYKDTLLCNSLKNMTEILPELGGLDAGRLGKAPIFTASFGDLPAKLGGGERFAVLGGPCILGTGEMIIRVIHRGGMSYCFDFNTGNHLGDLRDYDAVGHHIRDNADEIVKILFENKKNALTVQDYESLRLPIEIARLLDVPVIIPLPDSPYMKYISAVTSCAAPGVRASAAEDFAAEIRIVSKLFLDAIGELKRSLRPRELMAFHDGDKEGLKAFYDGRRPYYDKYISTGHELEQVTSKADRLDSVTDYIFYPALPFYLWGIKNIIEVDSIGETDSLRKCASAHGDALSIFGMLYPEMLDKSASRGMSMAAPEDKEYIK